VDPAHCRGVTGRFVKAELLDLSASALDQNNQHDNEKHTGNNLDNCGLVHVESPFSFDNKFVLCPWNFPDTITIRRRISRFETTKQAKGFHAIAWGQ
jgi:hypothetical protein